MAKRKAEENMKLTLPVSESRDHIQGPATALVTLVEYGDFECPYCAQAYMITNEIQERLGSKLRFVFRNFPVTKIRPHAYEAALAAEAAAAQGKFWEMYDYLFKHGQATTDDNLRRSAASLGLNLTRFDREFLDRMYSSLVLVFVFVVLYLLYYLFRLFSYYYYHVLLMRTNSNFIV